MSADLQRRVLVVETVPRGTEELRQALSGEGYYVALATGTTEAMRIVGNRVPGSVIVDSPRVRRRPRPSLVACARSRHSTSRARLESRRQRARQRCRSMRAQTTISFIRSRSTNS